MILAGHFGYNYMLSLPFWLFVAQKKKKKLRTSVVHLPDGTNTRALSLIHI